MNDPLFCIKPPNTLGSIANKQKNKSAEVNEKALEYEIASLMELKKCGKMEQALKRASLLLAKNPSQVRLYQIKGQISFFLKQYQESLNCYETFLHLEDSTQNGKNMIELEVNREEKRRVRSLYQYNCGLCLQKLGRHSEAIVKLKEAASLNKQKIEIYFALAQSYRIMGETNKMMQIYEKLACKMEGNYQVLKTIIDNLLDINDYRSVLKLADRELVGMKEKINDNSLYIMLLQTKAKSLRKLGDYQPSIPIYLQITRVSQDQNEVVNAYFRLADCYEKIGKKDETIECYQRILKAKPESLEALNNLANLRLRRQEYTESLLLLDSALTKCQQNRSSSNQVKILLIKSHRIVALMKLGRQEEAAQELKKVSTILQANESVEKEGQNIKENYKFIKNVVQKYQPTLGKLTNLQRQTAKSQLPSQLSEEVKTISNLLMNSITLELQSKCTQQDELQLLSQRINKLHKEILDFKLNTLKEHQISQIRVHDKIHEIEYILQRKEEEANKLANEMEQLKKEYADIYGMVNQINFDDHNGSLAKTIKTIKDKGKPLVAHYAQELYWVFNAYFVSIRLVANHLVSQGKHLVHLKGISSFFARFKSVFEFASHVPHIGAVCEAINSLLSLYLNQQSSFVYSQLNKAITRAFTSEKELQFALEAAILNLLKTDYIELTLEKNRQNKIQSEMTAYNRAVEWFHKQKTKLIKKFIQFQDETTEEILVKEQVIEDIGSILLYMIRSKAGNSFQPDPQLLQVSFKKALLQNFKENEMTSLYAKEQQKEKQAFSRQGGCTTKCQIY